MIKRPGTRDERQMLCEDDRSYRVRARLRYREQVVAEAEATAKAAEEAAEAEAVAKVAEAEATAKAAEEEFKAAEEEKKDAEKNLQGKLVAVLRAVTERCYGSSSPGAELP